MHILRSYGDPCDVRVALFEDLEPDAQSNTWRGYIEENDAIEDDLDELLARVVEEDTTIYPIYFDTEFQVVVKQRGSDTHESYVTARQQLQRIADETGGTLFKADKAEDLEGVYQRVASELQTLYSVSYNPADKNYNGNWRNVGVKVKNGVAVARTKRGFYAK